MPEKNEPFTFGLWVQLPPLAKVKGEGIMTVLAEVIKAAVARGNIQVVVALAKWTETSFKNLLRDGQIPLDHVEFVTSRQRLPLLMRLRAFLHTRKNTPPRRSLLGWALQALRRLPAVSDLCDRLWSTGRAVFRKLLATDSILLASACSLLVLSMLLVLGPPVFLLWVLPRLLLRNSFASNLTRRLQQLYQRCITNKIQMMRSRWVQWLAWAHQAIVEEEFRMLARAAHARSDVPVWYVSHPAAVQASDIGRPIIVAVPDLVYVDFSTVFNATGLQQIDKRIRDLVGNADAVVTYSEFVRREHVVRYLGREAETAHVIPHAAMNLEPFLQGAKRQYAGQTRRAALSLIRDFVRYEHRPSSSVLDFPADYLPNFPFHEVDFLFVSSQIRPHKNYLNLFRAFEIVLRRKHRNLKLFFTGRMELDTLDVNILCDFIRKTHLHMDIIAIPDLPSEVHAAFYHLAKLTIVPTLFEGGFPFQFTESLSVDTPVLMSSIPVTRETLPSDLARTMLFDPYDVDDIASRIDWGVVNRQELLARQKPFYADLRHRTWDAVLEDYLAVFRRVVENSRRDCIADCLDKPCPSLADAA